MDERKDDGRGGRERERDDDGGREMGRMVSTDRKE